MKKLLNLMKKAKKQGQSLVEYGLILALVSVVAIAVLQTMGNQIKTTVNTLTTRLNQANSIAQN
jgi:pilus assembly protein Flp/PilA